MRQLKIQNFTKNVRKTAKPQQQQRSSTALQQHISYSDDFKPPNLDNILPAEEVLDHPWRIVSTSDSCESLHMLDVKAMRETFKKEQ